MTNAQLMEVLKKFPNDAEVVFVNDDDGIHLHPTGEATIQKGLYSNAPNLQHLILVVEDE